MLFDLSHEYPPEFHEGVKARGNRRKANLEHLEGIRKTKGASNATFVKEAHLAKMNHKFERRQAVDDAWRKRKLMKSLGEERERDVRERLGSLRATNIDSKLLEREILEQDKISEIIEKGIATADLAVTKETEFKQARREKILQARIQRDMIRIREAELEAKRNKAIDTRTKEWNKNERHFAITLKQQLRTEERKRTILNEKKKALAFDLFHKFILSNCSA